MKFIIQKVLEAKVESEGEVVGQIGKGYLILVGLSVDDTDEYIDFVTDKFLNIRLFDDVQGNRWKESIKSLGLEILLVSQFTLFSVLKGNKPDFHLAMNNEKAKITFDKIVETTNNKYDPNKVKTGKFGAYMKVSLVNDGPTTIEWEYPGKKAENIANNKKHNTDKGKNNIKEDTKEDIKDNSKKEEEEINTHK